MLQKDMERDEKGKFNCDYCNYHSVRRADIMAHLQGKHGPKKHICTQCGYKTGFKGSFRKHMKRCNFLETGRCRWQKERDIFSNREASTEVEQSENVVSLCDDNSRSDEQVIEQSDKSSENLRRYSEELKSVRVSWTCNVKVSCYYVIGYSNYAITTRFNNSINTIVLAIYSAAVRDATRLLDLWSRMCVMPWVHWSVHIVVYRATPTVLMSNRRRVTTNVKRQWLRRRHIVKERFFENSRC